MLSTNRTFGVEFEGFGINKYDLCDALTQSNINAKVACYTDRDTSCWRIKSDASIRGSQGFEIVSPILKGNNGLEEMQKVLSIVNNFDPQVNSSCGFHVHWGVSDWTLPNFRNLCARYIKFERVIDTFMPPSRRGNNAHYCQGFRESFCQKMNTAKWWNRWRNVTTISGLASKLGHGRYHKLNLQSFWSHGTVEFRHHSGTFEIEKATNWVCFTNAMVEQSTNRDKLQNWVRSEENDKKDLAVLLKPMLTKGYINASIAKFFKKRQAHFGE